MIRILICTYARSRGQKGIGFRIPDPGSALECKAWSGSVALEAHDGGGGGGGGTQKHKQVIKKNGGIWGKFNKV
jgi:hypothetical protein